MSLSPPPDACELLLDPNKAHRGLSLSEGNRKVTWKDIEQLVIPNRKLFQSERQVLCREGLTGRCYWEVKRFGSVSIGATCGGPSLHGGDDNDDDCELGSDDTSWSLDCSDYGNTTRHGGDSSPLHCPAHFRSDRVGVYLDWPGGTLSFYSITPDTLFHLHTFRSTFTEPLYPGFVLSYRTYIPSVLLCRVTQAPSELDSCQA